MALYIPGHSQEDSACISFGAWHDSDLGVILSGRNKGKEFLLSKEDVSLEIQSDKIGLWKGGRLWLHGQATLGHMPTGDFVGDIQVFSNIEAGEHFGMYEAYYEQSFGRWSVLLGQLDLNAEFVVSDKSDIFTNSSFGIIPSISLNVPSSIFPLPGLCAMGRYSADRFTLRAGVFDGDPGTFESNPHGLGWSLSREQGAMVITELDLVLGNTDVPSGGLKLGAYYHSAEFSVLADTSLYHNGNAGGYVLAWHSLIAPRGGFAEGVDAFLQCGAMPPDRNMVDWYLGAGFRSRGLLASQKNDVAGLGVATSFLSRNYRPEGVALQPETAIEFNYRFFIGGRYFVQPIVQYIISPGGNPDAPAAIVGFVRLSISL